MTNAPRGHWRVGLDIGGTFTDVIVVDDHTGRFTIAKRLTTPAEPSLAIEQALTDATELAEIAIADLVTVVHGTTLITNAIIERKGDRTALLTTRGFRDAVEIGRESRYDLYDLMIEKPAPLVPRYLRFDVPERTAGDGSTIEPLDIAFVERLTHELAANQVQAIAVAFVNSFANPSAERTAREVIGRVAPTIRVSLSSEVSPEIREFERTSTTIANVYVQARFDRYVSDLEARLERLGFGGTLLMMLSNGGIGTVQTAKRFPIRLLESGPAAGALAAAHLGEQCGYRDLLSFDMGGTTAKFSVIDQGRPLLASEFEFDRMYRFKKGSGFPARIPVIEMVEIGAGGGSIARVDALGLLKVGPDSAGADPGPVCYGGGGTEPTVTDADLVLGYLDPRYFLGGRMTLDPDAARAAIKSRIADRLGLSIEDAAWGIHQVVNETMANAARVHVLERGKDPGRFPIFAFGGAGPVHGHHIMRALGSPALIVPLSAGVTSALGFLTAPIAFDFVRSWRTPLDQLDWRRANALLDEMESEGRALLADSGVPNDEIGVRRDADMRYVGQGHEIPVPLPEGPLGRETQASCLARFETKYRELFGRLGPPVAVELVNWRLVASGPKPGLKLDVPRIAPPIETARKGRRPAYFGDERGWLETPVYDRYLLGPGASVTGPAIIEERESTSIVGPGAQGRIDGHWNLIVEAR